MPEITIEHLCRSLAGGNKTLLLCEIFVNAKPTHPAQQVITRINNRIISVQRAGYLKHWSYDPNLLIGLKQLSAKLETGMKD